MGTFSSSSIMHAAAMLPLLFLLLSQTAAEIPTDPAPFLPAPGDGHFFGAANASSVRSVTVKLRGLETTGTTTEPPLSSNIRRLNVKSRGRPVTDESSVTIFRTRQRRLVAT